MESKKEIKRQSTLKEDLAEIKIVIEIMKKEIALLEAKLNQRNAPLYREDDLREMAQMKKK